MVETEEAEEGGLRSEGDRRSRSANKLKSRTQQGKQMWCAYQLVKVSIFFFKIRKILITQEQCRLARSKLT